MMKAIAVASPMYYKIDQDEPNRADDHKIDTDIGKPCSIHSLHLIAPVTFSEKSSDTLSGFLKLAVRDLLPCMAGVQLEA